jgi:hypothetical protein
MGTVGNLIPPPLLAVLALFGLGVIFKVAPERDDPPFAGSPRGGRRNRLMADRLVAVQLLRQQRRTVRQDLRRAGRCRRADAVLWLSAFVVLFGAETKAPVESQAGEQDRDAKGAGVAHPPVGVAKETCHSQRR